MKAQVSAFASALIVLATFLPSLPLARTNDKRLSLPASVLTARTVYVDNQTTSAELQNTAYTELSKWGRFQAVEAPQKADIVLRLWNANYVKSVPGGGSPANDPKPAKQNWMGADEVVSPGCTRVSVIDPKSGNSPWSDIRKTDNPKAATHMLDGLRNAFEVRDSPLQCLQRQRLSNR
jgi:hypothetical protein